MPRIVHLAAGTAAEFNPVGSAASAARCGAVCRYVMRALAIAAGVACIFFVNAAARRSPVVPNSPVPPASVSGPGKKTTLREGAGRRSEMCKGTTGSADNSWIFAIAVPKSLIVEKTCLTSQHRFSTSCLKNPTSQIIQRLACFLTSLSLKSLKKKEKALKDESKNDANSIPRVDREFPRVSGGAYFLIHETRPHPRVDSWKFSGLIFIKIRQLQTTCPHPTSPRVALRVVTLFGFKAKEFFA